MNAPFLSSNALPFTLIINLTDAIGTTLKKNQ